MGQQLQCRGMYIEGQNDGVGMVYKKDCFGKGPESQPQWSWLKQTEIKYLLGTTQFSRRRRPCERAPASARLISVLS